MMLRIGSRGAVRPALWAMGYASCANARRKTHGAFTLIEVLLAVVIMAIGIVGVLGAYTVMIGGLEASRYTIEAASLLKQKLGEKEEAVIESSGIAEGTESGRFEDYENYRWMIESRASDAAIKDLKEELKDFLYKVKIAVINDAVNPPRDFYLSTYMENDIE